MSRLQPLQIRFALLLAKSNLKLGRISFNYPVDDLKNRYNRFYVFYN